MKPINTATLSLEVSLLASKNPLINGKPVRPVLGHELRAMGDVYADGHPVAPDSIGKREDYFAQQTFRPLEGESLFDLFLKAEKDFEAAHPRPNPNLCDDSFSVWYREKEEACCRGIAAADPQRRKMEDALKLIQGFDSKDMGHQEYCDYVNEVVREALEMVKDSK